jgi:RNA 2',3'-cyclic 3'-phosphodiesterase
MNAAGTVERDERIRLFCALKLPGEAVERLAAWQQEAFAEMADVRVLSQEHLHVTLAFLGHRPVAELPEIVEALQAAGRVAERPSLAVRRYRETRSVGMLVLDDEDDRATRFATDLHERLERLGVYEAERRRWLPHLTVIRFRRPPKLSPSLPELGAVVPSEAAVYHSLLRPTGAQYAVIENVALGG